MSNGMSYLAYLLALALVEGICSVANLYLLMTGHVSLSLFAFPFDRYAITNVL
jgi:hypothetical protein